MTLVYHCPVKLFDRFSRRSNKVKSNLYAIVIETYILLIYWNKYTHYPHSRAQNWAQNWPEDQNWAQLTTRAAEPELPVLWCVIVAVLKIRFDVWEGMYPYLIDCGERIDFPVSEIRLFIIKWAVCEISTLSWGKEAAVGYHPGIRVDWGGSIRNETRRHGSKVVFDLREAVQSRPRPVNLMMISGGFI